MPRTRIRSLGGGLGTFTSTVGSFIGTASETHVTLMSKCVDEFGAHDLAFSTAHSQAKGAGITYKNPAGTKSLQNFVPSAWRTPSDLAPMADPARPGNSVLAVDVINKTNPSKAKVNLPVSLLELRELPMLVRDAGYSLISRIGENNLRYYFGIKPIVSDLTKLLEFQDSVDKRVKLLKKFRDEGSMLRKVALYSGIVSESPNTTLQANSVPSTSNITYILMQRTTTRQVWGYTRWTPDKDFSKDIVTDRDLLHYARTIIPGMRVDFATLWAAIPWSWLIDWYGNVGDWLESNRHVVPIYPSLPRICEIIRVNYSYLSSTNGFNMPPNVHSVTLETIHRSRTLVSASLPSTNFGLLSPAQALILPSVAAVKGRI